MILEMDVGNTRIKWRLRPIGAVEAARQGALVYEAGLGLALSELPLDEATGISLAAVLSDRKKSQLLDELSKCSNVQPWLAEVAAEALGVTCGYDNPAQLGVDRWLAMVAAYDRYKSAVCIIDAGSALTVDWVDAAGFHLGGYIVPGFSMAKALLLEKTEKVRFSGESRFNKEEDVAWPANTKDAVEMGLLRQCEGFLQSIEREVLSVSKQAAKIIVAGGDASLVSSLLATDVQVYEDIVLDGLSLLAPY